METVYWRRRGIAIGGAVVVVLLVVLLVRACGGDDDSGAPAGGTATTAEDAPPQLPRGGRVILPGNRVLAFYGAPQDDELGILGIGTPTRAGIRLKAVADRYAKLDPATPVLPAMELIAVVAAGAPGADGLYRTRQDDRTIRRYLRAARRIKALLILDVQPGRADFLQEARHLEKWLRQPDVSLALDPEWRVNAPDVPGQTIGSVSAQEVNAVSYWLSQLVQQHDLPQKLLLMHRFTGSMIPDQASIKQRKGLALAVNIDGFGDRPNKRAKYRELAAADDSFFDGFKLFYKEDTDLMTPRQVLALKPPPNVVVYE